MLGFCRHYGQGVTKDFAEAVNWYRKAADQGHAGAVKNLGLLTSQKSNDPVAEVKEPILGAANITEKLKRIIIPRMDLQDTTVEEAIDFLRLRAAELDATELDPARKGLNFVIIRTGANTAPASGGDPALRRIRELRLRNVPLAVAIKYVCDQTNLRCRIDDFAVTLEAAAP
jgi:hypothetical protein